MISTEESRSHHKMSIYLAQLVLLLAIGIVVLNARGVKRGVWNPRIVGGMEISIDEAPWQVAILNTLVSDSVWCGGVVYSENIIITAAHCLYGVPLQNLTVRAGSTYWHFGGEVREIAAFKLHGEYIHNDKNGLPKDIAVLRLDHPLTLSHVVKTIPLAKEEPTDGVSVTVSGWGSRGTVNSYPTHLHGVTVKVVNRRTCDSIYGGVPNKEFKITEDMICAGDEGKDSCHGDSGGPLVLEDRELVGIVSWGLGCGINPGVYASVPFFHKWLLDAIEDLSEE